MSEPKRKSEVGSPKNRVKNQEPKKKSEVGSPKNRVKNQEPGIKKPEVGSQKSKARNKSEVGSQKSGDEDNSTPDSYQDNIPQSELNEPPTAEHQATTELQTKNRPPDSYREQTEKMEVHHHPEVEKKGFKEYILEGLMIFLAVTMGFFAESLREHISDSNKEREYMISLTRDLKHDITALDGLLKYKSKKIELADSMLNTFEAADYKNNTANLYYWGRLLSQRIFFEPNNGTVQQLNNAGGLRLIHKEIVLDSLQSYINHVKNLTQIQDLEELQLMDYRRSISLVFDASEMNKMFISKTNLIIKKLNYNPLLNSYDKKDVNELKMRALTVKGNRLAEVSYMAQLRIDARALSDMVKKQYNLADE